MPTNATSAQHGAATSTLPLLLSSNLRKLSPTQTQSLKVATRAQFLAIAHSRTIQRTSLDLELREVRAVVALLQECKLLTTLLT